jgi:histidinol-phosphate aminotransferase
MSAVLNAAKPWVAALSTYQPGRPIEEVARELGLGDPESIIKLASNENALGPSPHAVAAMRARWRSACTSTRMATPSTCARPWPPLERAGEPSVFRPRQQRDHRPAGPCLPGKGTSIVMAQAFVVYRLVAALYEARPSKCPCANFTHDLEAMRAAIHPRHAAGVRGQSQQPHRHPG